MSTPAPRPVPAAPGAGSAPSAPLSLVPDSGSLRRVRKPPLRPRRRMPEEHVNHERWAIPYGDLITLLLAFFVVMYSMSQVNEGKYRVLAQSIAHAFSGAPKTIRPIQVGAQPTQSPLVSVIASLQPAAPEGAPLPRLLIAHDAPRADPTVPLEAEHATTPALGRVADDVETALAPLIRNGTVSVRRRPGWIEVAINTDILFPSGVAALSPQATPVLERIAAILAPLPNAIRIEGYTDDVPIHTAAFPSNWELSAARAASVARLFAEHSVDPRRLGVIGWSQYRPAADNATVQGRNRNRRVQIVVLGGDALPQRFYDVAGQDHARTAVTGSDPAAPPAEARAP